MRIESRYNTAHFFKLGGNKAQATEAAQSSQTQSDASHFGESKPVRDILAEIHRILNQKSEPSFEIKQWLINAFQFLKKSALSTSSIERLTKRLQEENTPAAKAIAEAHAKVNKLRMVKPLENKHEVSPCSFFKKPIPSTSARLEKERTLATSYRTRL